MVKTIDADQTGQKALHYFDHGYYCAESVLMALAGSLGMESELIPRIATGFGSGIARTSGTCGAVTGAVMALGLVEGRQTPSKDLEYLYQMIQSLTEGFKKEMGCSGCSEILGIDLNTEEGQIRFRAEHLELRCRKAVESAVRLTVQLLNTGV